jgi:hypothetical protein
MKARRVPTVDNAPDSDTIVPGSGSRGFVGALKTVMDVCFPGRFPYAVVCSHSISASNGPCVTPPAADDERGNKNLLITAGFLTTGTITVEYIRNAELISPPEGEDGSTGFGG